ncbi:MAG: methyltransferase [Proteobacteria bacterium]|nr:methyltransferase [Pseudomonadota bacterium]MBU1611611.1 methyltransferase [Pseudomonadota bacterium]
MAKTYDLDAPLKDLLEVARRDFGKVSFETFSQGKTSLNLLQILDMPAYLDRLVAKTRPGSPVELPLWAKVWPSASILAMFLSRFQVRTDAEVLEIGAGTGLAGLVLAAQGCRVTLTDIEPGALLFCRINALKNGLEDRVEVAQVDFTADTLDKRFDFILASELIYKERVLAPLVDFLHGHIKPEEGCEVFMASDAQREGRMFFELAQTRFKMMRKDIPFKDSETGKTKTVSLYRLGGNSPC